MVAVALQHRTPDKGRKQALSLSETTPRLRLEGQCRRLTSSSRACAWIRFVSHAGGRDLPAQPRSIGRDIRVARAERGRTRGDQTFCRTPKLVSSVMGGVGDVNVNNGRQLLLWLRSGPGKKRRTCTIDG